MKNVRMFGDGFVTYQSFVFGSPVEGALGLLFDTRQGLLWFAPFLAVGVASGLLRCRRRAEGARWLVVCALAVFAGYFAVTALWVYWRGGDSYGPRLLVPALPALALLLPTRSARSGSGHLRAVLAVAFIGGFTVQWCAALDPVPALGSPSAFTWSATAFRPRCRERWSARHCWLFWPVFQRRKVIKSSPEGQLPETRMIKPDVLGSELPHGPWSCRGCDIWDAIRAAASGDAAALRRLLGRDPNLYRAEYWYTQPIHFAVREGHLEVTRVLLDAGADPSTVGVSGEDLVTVARDRGHETVARLLEEVSDRRGPTTPADTRADHPIHAAAADGDAARVRALLDAEPELVRRSDRAGGTPLHRAVAASAREVAVLLLDRGADIHALHGTGPGSDSGYAAADFQPIDLALWSGPFWNVRGDVETARLLLERGAAHDLVIAAALGDLDRVRGFLDEDPRRIAEARPSGKRALSSAVELGHETVVRLLLDRGADPNWPDGANAPRGAALHAAARAGDRAVVDLLLAHRADPNGYIDSSGSATYVARTRELRALLMAHGGTLDTYDLVWLGEDDEVVRRVSEDPSSAHAGCGGVFAAACTLGKRDLLVRLLDAAARVPPMVTACRSYLLQDPGMLRLLLDSGMDPDLPNWQRATPLHDLCGRDGRGRPRPHRTECAAILLDAGATISARDEEYRSTPLAWAAKNDLPDMVELLLARGAATHLPDDEPWATPLAWATRRGHSRIAETLCGAGATA